MIEAVDAALADLGLLRPGCGARYHFGLTKGDTLWVDAFIGRDFYHVKASEVISLSKEVLSYEAAWSTFSKFMPRPRGRAVKSGWDMFVTQGLRYRPLFANALTSSVRASRVVDTTVGYFETSRRSAPVQSSSSEPAALLAALEARFKDSAFAPVLEPWATGPGQRELEALGSIAQHCDFVPNNLGTVDGHLVVFDWEDYGKVCLPGLDLCTLLISSADPDTDAAPARIAKHAGDVTHRTSLVERVCRALEMERAQFTRLVPLYLLVFLSLKEGYAADVRQRIGRLLQWLCSSKSDGSVW